MPAPKEMPWPPVTEPVLYDYTKGPYMYNCYAEKDSIGGVSAVKRQGWAQRFSTSGAANYHGQGFFIRKDGTRVTITEQGAFANEVPVVGSFPVSVVGQMYWFDETNGTPSFTYASNGTAGYTYSSAGAWAQITAANYVAIGTTVPGSAYLDGTLYVMDAQCRIYGSAINDLTTWSALNLIQAQDSPGTGVALAKHLSFVVALKDRAIEFFYDAANPTGSPLLPVPNSKLNIGCRYPHSVRRSGNDLLWVAWSTEGGPSVVRLQGMKLQSLSNPYIDRWLLAQATVGNGALPDLVGFVYSMAGHVFYQLTYVTTAVGAFGNILVPATDWRTGLVYPSLVVDVESGSWSFFQQAPFLLASCQTPGGVDRLLDFTYSGQWSLLPYGQWVIDSNPIYSIPATGVAISAILQTAPLDFGSQLTKVLQRLYLNIDKSDPSSAGSIQISWSDDNYRSWTPWVTVDTSQPKSFVAQLGSFVKRAFRFQHTAQATLRFDAPQLDLLVGTI
jgi:hypothetical protein